MNEDRVLNLVLEVIVTNATQNGRLSTVKPLAKDIFLFFFSKSYYYFHSH